MVAQRVRNAGSDGWCCVNGYHSSARDWRRVHTRCLRASVSSSVWAYSIGHAMGLSSRRPGSANSTRAPRIGRRVPGTFGRPRPCAATSQQPSHVYELGVDRLWGRCVEIAYVSPCALLPVEHPWEKRGGKALGRTLFTAADQCLGYPAKLFMRFARCPLLRGRPARKPSNADDNN